MNREQYIATLQTDNAKLEKDKRDLMKYIEDMIKERETTIENLEGTNSHRISILQVEIHNYKDILERIKSDKYE